jgi:hypothetical protein
LPTKHKGAGIFFSFGLQVSNRYWISLTYPDLPNLYQSSKSKRGGVGGGGGGCPSLLTYTFPEPTIPNPGRSFWEPLNFPIPSPKLYFLTFLKSMLVNVATVLYSQS